MNLMKTTITSLSGLAILAIGFGIGEYDGGRSATKAYEKTHELDYVEVVRNYTDSTTSIAGKMGNNKFVVANINDRNLNNYLEDSYQWDKEDIIVGNERVHANRLWIHTYQNSKLDGIKLNTVVITPWYDSGCMTTPEDTPGPTVLHIELQPRKQGESVQF